jgi:hypothetical protein
VVAALQFDRFSAALSLAVFFLFFFTVEAVLPPMQIQYAIVSRCDVRRL